MIYAPKSKLAKELKNSLEILIGQAVFKQKLACCVLYLKITNTFI